MSASSADGHLDLDGLVDLLAGDDVLGDDAAARDHVAGCAECRAELDELRAAQARVTEGLSALPPVSLPDDLATRIHDALRKAPADRRSGGPAGPGATADSAGSTTGPATGPGTVTTLPTTGSRSPLRWLPAAAAAVILLAGAGYGISRLGNDAGSSTADTTAGAKAGAPRLDVTRNNSGADYTDRASLSAALPDLLQGRGAARDNAMSAETAPAATAPAATTPQRGAGALAQPAPDPLARLRDNAGLADCLVALLPPDDPSVQPLAIDYASFRGKPALVVVLPGSAADKLDIYVVGPGCSQANDSLVFYTSVDKP